MKRRSWIVLFVAASLFAAQGAREVEITAEPSHHLAFENQYVRVFQVEVAPHTATLMHRHRHDYIFVTLGASEVESDAEGKPPVRLKLQDGETQFTLGNFAHIAKNLSDRPFRNVTIELLQDAKARKSPPPKWDEERGVEILEGGTKEILFVKDGERVSDIQLQPGGMLPENRHPRLLVAINDLDIKSDMKAQVPWNLKSGDVKWLPGGYTHTLTNVGKQKARFITLEFPTEKAAK